MTSRDAPRPAGDTKAVSAPAAAPSPPPEAEKPAAPAPAPKSSLARWVWPLVCLFQVGIIGGAFYFGKGLVKEEPPAKPEHTEKAETKEQKEPADKHAENHHEPSGREEPTGPVHSEQNLIADADDLFRQGRYAQALALCRPMSAKASAAVRDDLQYRVALCLEGLGRWDQALEAYRTLASQTDAQEAAAAAQLGQARVWVRMRRPAQGKKLLCDLILRSAEPGLKSKPILADVRFLLGLSLTIDALGPERPGPLNQAVVGHGVADWPLERVLDWTARPKDAEPPPPDDGKDAVSIQRIGPGGLDSILIKARVRQTTIPVLLDRIAEAARLRLEWSPQARQQVEERSLVIDVANLPLPDVLRALAEPVGLVWTAKGDHVQFSSEEELPRETLDALHSANARRALREAVLAAPQHPLAAAAYLELGNIEYAAGKIQEAVSWYGRVIRDWPRAPVAVEAHFNLGHAQRRLGDARAARNEWYRVIDGAPAHVLTPLAYLRIGRLHLEEGEFAEAISPLRRALQASSGAEAQPAAVVLLATAYLLGGKSSAANGVLLDYKTLVRQETYRPAAAFLDSLARYRTGTDRKLRQRDGGDLLAATLTILNDPVLGLPGQFLAGQAFQDVGMPEQMTGLYESLLKEVRGPLADEMIYALAEAYLASDQRSEALRKFGVLARGGNPRWAGKARLRLAELSLHAGQPADCVKWCKAALAGPGAPDTAAVLRLMARAYEDMARSENDPDAVKSLEQKVIACLSGRLPD